MAPGWEPGRVVEGTSLTVAVITDSASALPADVAHDHGVVVVPMGLSVGGLQVSESALGLDELLSRFDEGVATSAATPGDFAKAIERCEHAEAVVVLTLTGDLSSTYRAARLGAEEAGDGDRVRVLDTRTAAGAEGLVVLAAARAARAGAGVDGVEAAARMAMERVRLIGALSTLEYLVKGGHIPAAAGWAARRLNLQPLIELRDGKVRPLRPAFSREAALERILSLWRRTAEPGAALHVTAMHSLGQEDAEWLLDAVVSEVRPATALLSGFGTPLVAHTGPGLVGLAWWWEPPGHLPR